MPFDGTVVYTVCQALRQELLGGRIDKIYQPEASEIHLTLRSLGRTKRLLLTADAGHARIQLTEQKPETPLSPPMFCMLLRKYFGGGKLIGVLQHDFDRIVELQFEVLNELGDLCQRQIFLEMMGKHSNLILVDEGGRIIDSIRHVPPSMSSVRAVLPGLSYALPSHTHKQNPLLVASECAFTETMSSVTGSTVKALYQAYNGLCPFSAREILTLAALSETQTQETMTPERYTALYQGFQQFFRKLTQEAPRPVLYFNDDHPADYSVFPYRSMAATPSREWEALWPLLDTFYERQDSRDKLRQKSQDLHHLLSTNLERAHRKEALQLQQLEDTKDREHDRLCGELITANLYQLKANMTLAKLTNYYEEDAPVIEIGLDPTLTPAQNAQRYYQRYNKKKRTEQALSTQLLHTQEEISYLESIQSAMMLADCEKDLEDLRLELHQTGYLRKSRRSSKNLTASKPLSFRTSEGMEVLVGKNNIQNDMLTFKISDPYDLWFHVKDIPGSHVILRVAGKVLGQDYTEKSLQEAAELASRHSKTAGQGKTPVDYTLRRYVKKTSGAKPGFVIYTHQTTVYIDPVNE